MKFEEAIRTVDPPTPSDRLGDGKGHNTLVKGRVNKKKKSSDGNGNGKSFDELLNLADEESNKDQPTTKEHSGDVKYDSTFPGTTLNRTTKLKTRNTVNRYK